MALIALLGAGAFTTVGAAVAWYWNQKRTDRKDAIGEWKDLVETEQKNRVRDVERLQALLDKQDSYIKSLLERAGRAETAEARCQGQVSRLESDIRGMSIELRRLQERVWDLPPGVTGPCRVIASVPDGIIYEVSPEAGSMFHWLPKDLIGQSIAVLMPRDVRPVHRRAMMKMLEEGREADPGKPVLTFGVTKDGRRIPLQVNLSGPWGPDGQKFVNADLRRRGDSDVLLSVPGDPRLEDTVKAESSEDE